MSCCFFSYICIRIKYKSNNMKVVIIENAYEAYNNKPEFLNGIYKNRTVNISPAGKRAGMGLETGLTLDEQRELLPSVVGVGKDHRDFFTKVEEYYSELVVKVKHQGTTLQIETTDKGTPVNMPEYLTYKFLLAMNSVANPGERPNPLAHRYALVDEESNIDKQSDIVEARKKAYTLFSKLDKTEYKMFLSLMGTTDVESLRSEATSVKLDNLVTTKPVLFLRVATSVGTAAKPGDGRIEYLIHRMITFGVLTKSGNRIINKNVDIGVMETAVTWFKNASNNEEVTRLKAKLKQLTTINKK